MQKVIAFFKDIKNRLVDIFVGGNIAVTAIATIVVLLVISVAGIYIIQAITADTADAASVTVNESKSFDTSESITTVPETTTMDETTTEEPTTEEATTEEPTTVPETTPVPTTVPETIPIEELSTVSNDEGEQFDAKQQAATQAPAPEPATEAPTQKPTEAPTRSPKVSEVAKVVKGIDVSKWQGKIDWAKVKQDGIDFAIIRVAGRSIASSGELYEDNYFRQNLEGALANGIPVGVYFFSQAITEREAQEEASYILSLIKGYKITYPVVFDWETSSGYRTQVSLSREKMNSIASTFCDMVKAAGYTPMVYGNTWDLMNRYNTTEICSKYKIWMANYMNWNNPVYVNKYQANPGTRYQTGDPIPTGYNYPSFQMWQYCSKGRVKGIDSNGDGLYNDDVDMNVSFFTYSGTEVPTTAIKINLKNTTFTTNINTPVDLTAGVEAYNTAGLEQTSSLTVTLTNENGETVASDIAFQTAGTYTVTYSLKDFTGASKSVSAKLIVRGAPVITLTDDEIFLTYTEGTDFIASLAGGSNDTLLSYIASVKDFENNDLSGQLTITYDDGLKKMLEENEVVSGSYTVTFSVADAGGLSSEISLTVVIADMETTTPPETTPPSETTTSSETTQEETTTQEVAIPQETTSLRAKDDPSETPED